jgi:portal protein
VLADAYDPVRLIIERRKDQLCRVPWAIRQKHPDAGKRPKKEQISPQMRATIKEVEGFFKFPTPGLSFRTWLRELLEDLLVLDAPALFCERDSTGTLTALSPTDGGSLKPIINEQGRSPRPWRWDGSAFQWLGQTVTPANFASMGFKITNGLIYPPTYQQILKGLPAVNYNEWDLIVRPLNLRTNRVFGRSPVEQIMTTVSIAMRRSASQLEYFREGNQPAAIYGLPETWGPDQVQRFQDYFDSLYSGNLGNRRKMKFIPSGTNSRYHELHEPPLKSEFDEWLTRICCFAFSYPPQAFVALSNRSTAEQHEKTAEEEGTEPLKLWFADMANDIIEREFDDSVEFAWTEEQEIEPEKQKNILVGYADAGVMTINQVREKIGEEPDPDPAANKLMVRTPTGYVPIGGGAKGDDDNGIPRISPPTAS